MLFALIKKELLALTRDVHGLAALFLMPTLFIVIMSLALKDVYRPPVKTLAYVVDNRDNGPLAATLIDAWEQRHGKPQDYPAGWTDAVQRGKLSYALIIEKDFSKVIVDETLTDGIQAHLLTDPGLDGGAFAANQAELVLIASELRAQALLAASRRQSRPPTQTPGATAEAPVIVSAQSLVGSKRLAAGSRPTAVQQNVPAWLVS